MRTHVMTCDSEAVATIIVAGLDSKFGFSFFYEPAFTAGEYAVWHSSETNRAPARAVVDCWLCFGLGVMYGAEAEMDAVKLALYLRVNEVADNTDMEAVTEMAAAELALYLQEDEATEAAYDRYAAGGV